MPFALTFLGTGCDYSSKDREVTCILVECGYDKVLLDCCPGILRQLDAINIDPIEIGSIFLSHTHGGHFLGFPLFIFGSLPKGRKDPLLVMAPEGMKRVIDTVLDLIYPKYMKAVRQRFEIEISEIDTGGFSEKKINDRIKITTAPIDHDIPTLGCCLEFLDYGIKIAYSSDTRKCKNMETLAKNANFLIHDATFEHAAVKWAEERAHSTVRQAAEIARDASVEVLILVHMHHTRYDRENIEKLYLKEAKEVFNGEVLIPKDLNKVDLFSYSTVAKT